MSSWKPCGLPSRNVGETPFVATVSATAPMPSASTVWARASSPARA